jgi:hypothetical protein
MRGRRREFGPKRRNAARPRDRGCCHALAFRGSVFQLVSVGYKVDVTRATKALFRRRVRDRDCAHQP